MRAAGSGGPVMREERSYARADGVLRASWPHESAMGADELCSFFDERR